MGGIAWDKLIDNLPELDAKVRDTGKKIDDTENLIITERDKFNKVLMQAQLINTTNTSLSFVLAMSKLDDSAFRDFKLEFVDKEVKLPDPISADIVSFVGELVGGGGFATGIFLAGKSLDERLFGGAIASKLSSLSSAAKDSIRSVFSRAAEVGVVEIEMADMSREVAITPEAIGPAVSLEATETALSRTTLCGLLRSTAGKAVGGFIAGFGIDIIADAIKGQSEKKSYEESLGKLDTQLAKMTKLDTEVTEKTGQATEILIEQMKHFIVLVDELAKDTKIQPDFKYKLDPIAENGDKFKDASKSALTRYAVITALRKDFVNYLSRHPNPSKENYLEHFLDGQDAKVTKETVSAYYDYLKSASAAMRAAEKVAADTHS